MLNLPKSVLANKVRENLSICKTYINNNDDVSFLCLNLKGRNSLLARF